MGNKNLIIEETFQRAWIRASQLLASKNWKTRNLIIDVKNPGSFNSTIHNEIVKFTNINHLMGPKHVAYTIFPHKLYKRCKRSSKLFIEYNRKGGLYERLRRRPHRSWGTYFRRMTSYETKEGIINQLENIIDAINNRQNIFAAAYTIVIQKPGKETIRPRGGPCLNYTALQLNNQSKELGLLCLYRNHDYLIRAYGNFWGLCNLLKFITKETALKLGSLAIVSSHAYIDTKRREFKSLIETLNEML